MARAWYINGESMVQVKGPAGTLLANVQQLGLSDGPIRVQPKFIHKDIQVDAWGQTVPPEVQFMLAEVSISMNLVNVDVPVLQQCIQEAMGGALVYGQLARAGTLMGGNVVQYNANNHYISLGILSPVGGIPYRFITSYLTGQPLEIPLGTEKSVFQLNWRCIPWTLDPWQGGTGAQNYPLWDNNVD